MKTERKSAWVTKVEAHGVRGMKSVAWRKVFASHAAFERWLEKNAEDVEVFGTRNVTTAG